jgi:NAD(P)-dependent dehydrogenase (short-subunit alcohol dehydrogenase family)
MTVLVVGGRGGIGAATVRLLERDGTDCAVLDRADGVDAADPQQVRGYLAGNGITELSAVVVLAGRAGSGGIDDTDIDQWRGLMRDNLDSAYVVIRESLPLLRAFPGDRSIVLLSSVNGRHGGNNLSGPAYATAKAAILGLTRHLAVTLAAEGIRVNAIAPGPVETPMLHRLSTQERAGLLRAIPLGHTAEPAEIAGTVRFLLSRSAASITGAVIDVNGGMWVG